MSFFEDAECANDLEASLLRFAASAALVDCEQNLPGALLGEGNGFEFASSKALLRRGSIRPGVRISSQGGGLDIHDLTGSGADGSSSSSWTAGGMTTSP